jgi:predicted naringenin-chalcone synthase
MEAVLEVTPELTEAELVRITGYRRPSKQIEILKSLGIPACMRRDNSVLVMRMHCIAPAQAANFPVKREPRLK